jgi:predicted  nucleic acid-binding Zn-ribbon protein
MQGAQVKYKKCDWSMKTKKKRLEKYSPSERQMSKRVAVPVNERCCGNCAMIADEDTNGIGSCWFFDCIVRCGDEGCDECSDELIN